MSISGNYCCSSIPESYICGFLGYLIFSFKKNWLFQRKAVPSQIPEPAQPLNDAQPTTNRGQCQTCLNIAAVRRGKRFLEAQMCGSFYFYTMSNRISFQKPYTSAHDLVWLLQSRGLTITDTTKAESYLEYIGYYRLSAYMYPLLQMPKEQHRYKPSATFSQVMMLYHFDKKLRLLIFNEIEKIEVAVRSAIVNIGSAMTGNPFWMTDCSNFIDAGKSSELYTRWARMEIVYILAFLLKKCLLSKSFSGF